jgi:acylphosphatase
VRTRVWVTGRVQGVWFRDACRAEARARGIGGWVRNRADGRVEAVFEGPPGSVAALVEWCHTGPPRAIVTRVEQRREEPEGLASFRVR